MAKDKSKGKGRPMPKQFKKPTRKGAHGIRVKRKSDDSLDLDATLDWGSGKLAVTLRYTDIEDEPLLDAIEGRLVELAEANPPTNGSEPEQIEAFINSTIGGLVQISSEIGTAFKTGEYYE